MQADAIEVAGTNAGCPTCMRQRPVLDSWMAFPTQRQGSLLVQRNSWSTKQQLDDPKRLQKMIGSMRSGCDSQHSIPEHDPLISEGCGCNTVIPVGEAREQIQPDFVGQRLQVRDNGQIRFTSRRAEKSI